MLVSRIRSIERLWLWYRKQSRRKWELSAVGQIMKVMMSVAKNGEFRPFNYEGAERIYLQREIPWGDIIHNRYSINIYVVGFSSVIIKRKHRHRNAHIVCPIIK